jgi:hypothetical protein
MRVFINAQAFEVEGGPLTGAQIKSLSRSEGQQIFRLRGDDQIAVADDEAIALEDGDRFIAVTSEAQAGVEEAARLITIFVEGDPYETNRRVLTGSEIKALAKKPPGNRLFRLAGEGQRIQIADDEKVHLHDREQFVTLPPVGKAS